ncbi:MAG: hypothetical protein M3285_05020 [Actinomycetota bacterium]|nr:hypothetical protein [Actinomycetota bacterium]
MKLARGLLVPVLAGLFLTALPSQAAVEKSKNVTLLKRFTYEGAGGFFDGGTDIAWRGKYVYAAQQGDAGGIHVLDASKRIPKEIAFVKCPGNQNDVAVVKPGLIAIGAHSSNCAVPIKGVRLVDVRNPKRPKMLGHVTLPGGTHTLTVYPGKPIIYASPGGTANGGGVEQIVDVSNPKKPKVVGTFTPNRAGCHDLAFDIRKNRKVAICPGLGETQVWDVTKPTEPVTIAHIPGTMFFPHSAAVSSDGELLVLGDENFGANDCRGGPTGAMWIYDFSDASVPVLQSYYGINRGPDPISSPDVDTAGWCTAHLFNFIPGTHTLVASWYGAGMNVLDLSDPLSPKEIAYYAGDDVNYWSAYWYDGRIWANDRVRGLDVFKVKGLKEK